MFAGVPEGRPRPKAQHCTPAPQNPVPPHVQSLRSGRLLPLACGSVGSHCHPSPLGSFSWAGRLRAASACLHSPRRSGHSHPVLGLAPPALNQPHPPPVQPAPAAAQAATPPLPPFPPPPQGAGALASLSILWCVIGGWGCAISPGDSLSFAAALRFLLAFHCHFPRWRRLTDAGASVDGGPLFFHLLGRKRPHWFYSYFSVRLLLAYGSGRRGCLINEPRRHGSGLCSNLTVSLF